MCFIVSSPLPTSLDVEISKMLKTHPFAYLFNLLRCFLGEKNL